MAQPRAVGIDVGKAQLDLAVHGGRTWSCPNRPAAHAALVTELVALAPTVVVIEATGGYELAVCRALEAAGLPLARVNPRQVRDLGRGTGQLAKTDRLDARLLARYGAILQPAARPLPGAEREALAALVHRREELKGMLAAERQRHAECPVHQTALAAASRARHLAFLTAELAAIDAAIRQVIGADAELARTDALLQSMPGVGPTLAAVLLAYLPELGQLSRKAIAALAGVAPLACDSGQRRGQRRCWGGRANLRPALFMGALVASRHHPVYREFYTQKVAAGKPKKVALTAIMRKLLVALNAMVRDGQPWQQSELAA
jgi:transposase